MSAKLNPGDRCIKLSKTGLKLRYVVADHLDMGKIRGEAEMVPVTRLINRRNRVNLDNPSARVKPPKITWVKRAELRKLP